MKILCIASLIMLGSKCLCASVTEQNQPDFNKSSASTTVIKCQPIITKPVSNMIVIYIPYQPYRIFGIGPNNMQQALCEYQAKHESNPYGRDSYATVIQSQEQKEILSGIFRDKATKIKPSNDDSEVLIDDVSTDTQFIVDRFGVVTEGNRVYKLQPQAYNKLHEILGKMFPQSLQNAILEKANEKKMCEKSKLKD